MFRASPRGLLDFVATALCLWAAAWHTPVGALGRGVVAKVSGATSSARPLLAYFSGGVYDAREVELPRLEPMPGPEAPLPGAAPVSAGDALGHGVYAVLSRPGTTSRAEALGARYGLGPPDSPLAVATLVARARDELGSDEAAVLALFVGPEVAGYATARARAEGAAPTLEVLARQLPPGRSSALEAASQALMFGTAFGLSWPVAPGTRITSPFGLRAHPTLGRQQLHTGVDLSVPEGTPVKVVAAGVVRRASEDAVNGKVVIVDHGRGVTTAYCHNSRLLVTAGQHVEAGQAVSVSGNTGRSTGPHLHYQLELGRRPVDPLRFRGRGGAVGGLVPASPGPRLPEPATGRRALEEAFERAGRPPEDTEVPP
ncbi:MAG: M23 family metallopeptidase [Myxococcaceae bacterium]|jgi:murein DD-endopeptidase|nr:M23 family metallopeptidase [Myxococcaceae bacterium]MCA3015395.1 M23 family metallopeptidase [Myxococcaceae bacterium]